MDKIITAKDLCKTYITDSISNNVLCNVNFEMDEGEFVSIMGPSGSGKSTLLYTISGMDSPTSGKVIFCGKDLSATDRKELNDIRLNKMGFIFQQMYMLKKLCIIDNIVLPAYEAGGSRKEINARAESLMRRLGIIETAEHRITEVSGGELQRACLCRALINSPKVIFADEPTGALNSKAAKEVMHELTKANEDGTAILMVTHSARVAACSERVIYLMDGGICGELKLGKTVDNSDHGERERKVRAWLTNQGW